LTFVAWFGFGHNREIVRALHHRYSWHEYLMLERSSNTKHEYCDGEILAMGGGTPEHSALSVAVVSELRSQLTGKPCRPYNSDLRIRVLATGLGTFPDVSVVCGDPEHDPEDRNTLVNPTLLVEVLSNSTEAYDRGDKFDNYKRIPALKQFVLVSHRERLLEVFDRVAHGDWKLTLVHQGEKALLDSIGCVLEVDRVYAGIDIERSS
jgi:Uma2 family endonuclease